MNFINNNQSIDFGFVFILILFAGWVIGGGINYLVDLLTAKDRESAHACSFCFKPFSWVDYLIPWKCRHCSAPRPFRFYFVQILFPILCASIWIFPPKRLDFLSAIILTIFFFLVAVVDLEIRYIYNFISVIGAGIGFVIGWNIHGLPATITGGIAGFLIMLLIYFFGKGYIRMLEKRRNQKIDEVALGLGDVYLGGILGLLLGFPGIIAGLILGILLGGIYSLVILVISRIRSKYSPLMAIPYAPFLIMGSLFLILKP